MNRLFTANDDAKRKRMASVTSLVRSMSVQAAQRGKIAFPWDGRSVAGAPVEAFVNFGRWLAQCDLCGNHEYVDPDTPIFFCANCGNGDSRAARPVEFPFDREQIEATLMARPIVPGVGKDDVQRAMNGFPAIEGLGREWRPGVSAKDLEKENEKKFKEKAEKKGSEEELNEL